MEINELKRKIDILLENIEKKSNNSFHFFHYHYLSYNSICIFYIFL